MTSVQGWHVICGFVRANQRLTTEWQAVFAHKERALSHAKLLMAEKAGKDRWTLDRREPAGQTLRWWAQQEFVEVRND